jgi:hypothetical protein
MKNTNRIFAASLLLLLIPFTFASGQEKKNEQRIKIVIAEDNGSKVVLDTLITGNPANDSIVLKNGNTIYLAKDDNDSGEGFTRKYIVTSSSEPDNGKKVIKKEITVISTDSDETDEPGNNNHPSKKCETIVSSGKYSSCSGSATRDSNSEKTKYVINRDGVVITVEGSDYARVKEIIKDIEKTLDNQNKGK